MLHFQGSFEEGEEEKEKRHKGKETVTEMQGGRSEGKKKGGRSHLQLSYSPVFKLGEVVQGIEATCFQIIFFAKLEVHG